MTRLVVIGLDGAGFQLLGDWLEDGTLPALSRLRENGRWATLRSSFPPVTCPAWRCYSTGMNPGKLGVYWWEKFLRDSREFAIPTAESFDVPDIWDHLGRAGFESAVVNLPTTYPPRSIDGWLVSDTEREDDYTRPETIRDELKRELGYEHTFPYPVSTLRDHPERLDDVLEFTSQRFEAVRYLRDTYDPDFVHFTLFMTNAIQHYFWDDDVLRRLWKRVDRDVDDFLTGEENVIVMSDHGSNRIETVFNVNTWLEEHDYLATDTGASDYLHSAGLDRQTVIDLIDRVGIGSVVKRNVPQWLVDYSDHVLPKADGSVSSAAKSEKVDWERTDAIASGQGPIYVVAEGSRHEAIKDDLRRELSAVTGPNGSPIARDVLDAEAVYEGPHVDEGPDLVVDFADGVHIPGTIGAESSFVAPDAWKWESENHRDGLLIAAGPDVDAGGRLSDQPTLYDLAPTILHWFDCPIPTQLDGDVLHELFRPESGPGSRDVRHEERPLPSVSNDHGRSNHDEVRERLSDLGYLSK